MEQGWVKSHRQMLDNHFLMKDNNAYIVFTKLMLMVNAKGELAAGRRQLADLLYMNDRTLYGVLIRLENEGMIQIKSNPRYSIIAISNWHIYQSNSKKEADKANRGQKKVATAFATGLKQGSFDELATATSTTAQPQRNRSATTAQHSNKNKKENKNINDTNVSLANASKPDINILFEYWEQTTGTAIHANVQKNRYACSNLLKKFGLEKTQQLVDGVAKAQADRYAPRISDFVSLQSKLNDLLVWGRAQIGTTKGIYKV